MALRHAEDPHGGAARVLPFPMVYCISGWDSMPGTFSTTYQKRPSCLACMERQKTVGRGACSEYVQTCVNESRGGDAIDIVRESGVPPPESETGESVPVELVHVLKSVCNRSSGRR
eukprot:scaffold243625_cov51-Prasinocladus_malaysianus.AAC.1